MVKNDDKMGNMAAMIEILAMVAMVAKRGNIVVMTEKAMGRQ